MFGIIPRVRKALRIMCGIIVWAHHVNVSSRGARSIACVMLWGMVWVMSRVEKHWKAGCVTPAWFHLLCVKFKG